MIVIKNADLSPNVGKIVFLKTRCNLGKMGYTFFNVWEIALFYAIIIRVRF